MKIKVKYLFPFRDITSKAEEFIEIEEPNLKGLIELVIKKYGYRFAQKLFDLEAGRIRKGYTVLVGGARKDLEASLKDGDEVIFMTAMGGG